MSEHQMYALARAVENDLNAANVKLDELLRQIGELPVDERSRSSFMNGPVTADCCPECGIGGAHTADCTVMV